MTADIREYPTYLRLLDQLWEESPNSARILPSRFQLSFPSVKGNPPVVQLSCLQPPYGTHTSFSLHLEQQWIDVARVLVLFFSKVCISPIVVCVQTFPASITYDGAKPVSVHTQSRDLSCEVSLNSDGYDLLANKKSNKNITCVHIMTIHCHFASIYPLVYTDTKVNKYLRITT